MKTGICFAVIASFISLTAFAGENCTKDNKRAVCTDESVKTKVQWACDLVKSKGKESLKEIKKMRYDCCGEPNYVWINDMHPKMIMHPIKPMLDNTDLTNNKDPDGKALFVEFVNAVKATPSGAWVDYKWTKFGEKDPTAKKSWVMKCNASGDDWVVGSGTWK